MYKANSRNMQRRAFSDPAAGVSEKQIELRRKEAAARALERERLKAISAEDREWLSKNKSAPHSAKAGTKQPIGFSSIRKTLSTHPALASWLANNLPRESIGRTQYARMKLFADQAPIHIIRVREKKKTFDADLLLVQEAEGDLILLAKLKVGAILNYLSDQCDFGALRLSSRLRGVEITFAFDGLSYQRLL